MSVEKQARRALWRMVFWRMVGELVSLPKALFSVGGMVLEAIAQWFQRVEMALFSLELDAARRYKLLTGVDMGTAMRQPGRYGLVNNPEVADELQQTILDMQRPHLDE